MKFINYEIVVFYYIFIYVVKKNIEIINKLYYYVVFYIIF